MNVHRSPPSSQSQPDLSKISLAEIDREQITHRKRKRPENDDQIRNDLKEFRQEVLSLFKELAQTQNTHMEKIAGDISSIRDQINIIQQKTDHLVLDHEKFKIEMAELKNNTNNTASKVATLETDVQDLKASMTSELTTGSPMLIRCEDLLKEIGERSVREKNIILLGIPETQWDNRQERATADTEEVTKLIKMTDPNCTSPLTTVRLGKYMPNKTRPIKATFSVATTVKSILVNKAKIEHSNIKIYSDKTPHQQKFIKNLKEELQKRTNNG